MLTLPLILAAISAGLIGGFHCVGMCGGIASLLSRLPSIRASQSFSSNINEDLMPTLAGQTKQKVIAIHPVQESALGGDSVRQFDQIAYQCKLHGGRLSTYALIGAFFGGMGAFSLRWKADFPVTTILFVIGNIALIILGLRLLGVRLHALVPPSISHKVSLAYASLMPNLQKAGAHPFFLGMAWGALPCGLSYAIAPFALLSGAAWSGAALMLLFGLAALPHLLIAQTISRQLKQHGLMLTLQIFSALVLIGFGLLGLFYFDMKNMPAFLCITPS
jgi:sulfite exporter TauE/SafE